MDMEKRLFLQKTCNISETEQDRARVAIDCLYKIIHEILIAGKIDDLEWPLSVIKGYL